MPRIIPDLTNPRYRDEVGWFLYHEKYDRDKFGGSYDAERVAYSRLLLEEVLRFAERDTKWLADKTVVSIGCGCTGDIAAFPAALKIGIDPLLFVYQKLGLLMADEAGSRTVYLSLGAENLPLLDDFADLIICRNALDHMPKPELALDEFRRILKNDGVFFASVDIGGEPTPDEPTVFSVESLRALLDEYFDVLTFADDYPPHSKGRVCSTKVVGRKKASANQQLDREMISCVPMRARLLPTEVPARRRAAFAIHDNYPVTQLHTLRYLDFYNGRRPHLSLDGTTADQAYFRPLPFRVAA